MLNGLHILLTYQCLYECDHCFLHCGPRASGTFTLPAVRDAVEQAAAAGLEWLYVEGGEPFLYYPLMLETLRLARRLGMRTGVVTNGYWAVSEDDALLCLKPLEEIGIDDLSVSEDLFHSDDPERSPARTACRAAERLGIPSRKICIEKPIVQSDAERHGEPVAGGGASLRGRAAEKLAAGLPMRSYDCFTECTEEELAEPGRVHLDPFGNVLVCQGLSIGNVRGGGLSRIMREYRPASHPIVGPLLQGGPAELARMYGLPEGEMYASACHLCYLTRARLTGRFPAHLCPEQVYGKS